MRQDENSGSPRLKTSMATNVKMTGVEGPQLHFVVAGQAAEEENLGRERKVT